MKIDELRKAFTVYKDLVKVAGQLYYQDIDACNYGLTSRREKRIENLEKKAQELAKELGKVTYHQGNPLGCTLYLLDKKDEKKADQVYSTRGIAIY